MPRQDRGSPSARASRGDAPEPDVQSDRGGRRGSDRAPRLRSASSPRARPRAAGGRCAARSRTSARARPAPRSHARFPRSASPAPRASRAAVRGSRPRRRPRPCVRPRSGGTRSRSRGTGSRRSSGRAGRSGDRGRRHSSSRSPPPRPRSRRRGTGRRRKSDPLEQLAEVGREIALVTGRRSRRRFRNRRGVHRRDHTRRRVADAEQAALPLGEHLEAHGRLVETRRELLELTQRMPFRLADGLPGRLDRQGSVTSRPSAPFLRLTRRGGPATAGAV